VDLLVTDRAVLKTWRTQIVERWRHYSDNRARIVYAGQIRVALQTNQAHLLPDQHARIGRAMRFMTRPATLKPHGGVLKCKGSAFVPVAVEASRLVGAERLHHRRTDAAVRIVAIDTRHGAFGQFMVIRLLELRPYIQVTTRTLLVDGGSLADHQIMSPVRMYLMTGCAGNLVLHVTALEAADVRRLVQVATEAYLVGGNRGQLARILDIRGRSRFRMFLPRTVTGFT
jgi:hypothetical protein